VWRVAFGFDLDTWQHELLRAILELYPEGHPRAGQLRYRQVVVSLGRQNGKTEIAAALGLIGLLRAPNQLVIGLASSREQAALIDKRTLAAIASNPSLKKRFKALTDTRGIRSLDGGQYELKAAKGAALQGLPVNLGVIDELHLLKSELWNALLNGLGGRPNGLLVGVTTAGSEESELLADLYATGRRAAEGAPELERFGFFLWEAPEARVPDNDAQLLEWLKQANPALASGRLDAENVLSDVRTQPPGDIIRYRLNRFTESTETFIPLSLWGACARPLGVEFPTGPDLRPVFAIDRTPGHDFATITENVMTTDGIVHTKVIWSRMRPTLEQLVDTCARLYRHSPSVYVMDSLGLKDLAGELKRRGLPVVTLGLGEVVNASSGFYSKTVSKRISHAGDQLLSVQLPGTIRKTKGDGFRVIAREKGMQIDAAMSTIFGVYWAERAASDSPLQVF
jgi:phage terminase large subunit-like protein